jgi:hypothetical protein
LTTSFTIFKPHYRFRGNSANTRISEGIRFASSTAGVSLLEAQKPKSSPQFSDKMEHLDEQLIGFLSA